MAEKKKKKKINISSGIVHILNSFNNTIISVSDLTGNVLTWSSAGALNFRGAKKSTPYASQVVASTVMEEAIKYGLKQVKVLVKGPGYGRESAIRSVAKSGVKILSIEDVTGVPHNGCRPRKVRRI